MREEDCVMYFTYFISMQVGSRHKVSTRSPTAKLLVKPGDGQYFANFDHLPDLIDSLIRSTFKTKSAVTLSTALSTPCLALSVSKGASKAKPQTTAAGEFILVSGGALVFEYDFVP